MNKICAVILAGLVTAGCSKSSKENQRPDAGNLVEAKTLPVFRVQITDVAIRMQDPAQPREMYERVLAQKAGQLAVSSGVFLGHASEVSTKEPIVPAMLTLRVQYDVVPQQGGATTLVAVVVAEITWQQEQHRLAPIEKVLAERPQPANSDLDGAMAKHVEETVLAAVRGLVAKETLRIAEETRLLGVLTTGEVDEILWALEVVRDRKISSAGSLAIALLDSANKEIQAEALTTIVALRVRSAVGTLTKRAQFNDRAQMHSIIEALSVLGGVEAVEFLQFVASGHPETSIRQHALEAQNRLERQPPRQLGK